MAETIILDDAAVASARTALDITPFIAAEGPDWGDAQIEAYMAEGSRGQFPVAYRIPNRTVTIPLRILTRGATTFDTFRTNLQAKVGLFQREGGWLSRQTSVGTLYMDVVNATLKYGGSWFQANRGMDPDATLTLECIPDFYGAEITLDDIVQTTQPEIATTLKLAAANAVIKGDYPGRCRIVVDEDQGQAQMGLIWGFRSRYYSSASTAALSYEAEALTLATSSNLNTITGASGAGTNNTVVSGSLLVGGWTSILTTKIATGALEMTHKGTYRVWARVYTSSSNPQIRLKWDVGDLTLPEVNSAVTIPTAGNFFIANLGEIRLDAPPVGTHRWQGIIEGTSTSGTSLVAIDKLWFVPVDDGYGVLRASMDTESGTPVLTASDGFAQGGGTALTGKTMPVGGVWAGAGDADDHITRADIQITQRGGTVDVGGLTGGRYAISGSSNQTNTIVQVNFAANRPAAAATDFYGVFARYVDVNNWLMFYWQEVHNAGGSAGWVSSTLYVAKRVAGTVTTLQSTPVPWAGQQLDSLNAWFTLMLRVDTLGNYSAYIAKTNTALGNPILSGQDSVLATGGTLQTGKPGFYHVFVGGLSFFDNFQAQSFTLTAVDSVLFPSQSAELRHDGMFREDSAGVSYGPITQVTGDLPRVPPSGLEARPVEMFLKASRSDLASTQDTGVDDISARVSYRPSWLIVPTP